MLPTRVIDLPKVFCKSLIPTQILLLSRLKASFVLSLRNSRFVIFKPGYPYPLECLVLKGQTPSQAATATGSHRSLVEGWFLVFLRVGQSLLRLCVVEE